VKFPLAPFRPSVDDSGRVAGGWILIVVLALVAASFFTGAAMLVTVAEQPARLALDDQPMLIEWRRSYDRAAPMQGGLALFTGLLGLADWWLHGSHWSLLGAVLILACWPFVLIVVMPVNRRLKALRLDEIDAARPLVLKWGRYHLVRTALGTAATVALAMNFLQ
jgi:hypothetical protein